MEKMIPTRFRNYLLLLLLIVSAGYVLLSVVMGEFNPILWDKKTRTEAAGGTVVIAVLLWYQCFD